MLVNSFSDQTKLYRAGQFSIDAAMCLVGDVYLTPVLVVVEYYVFT